MSGEDQIVQACMQMVIRTVCPDCSVSSGAAKVWGEEARGQL